MHRLRVMTWNLWWRFGPQWQERQPGIAATIRAANPDLVALQEVWAAGVTTQVHHLAAELGLRAGYAAPGSPPIPRWTGHCPSWWREI